MEFLNSVQKQDLLLESPVALLMLLIQDPPWEKTLRGAAVMDLGFRCLGKHGILKQRLETYYVEAY